MLSKRYKKLDKKTNELKAESIIKKKKEASEVKLFGTPLQKGMVLKEILDKPRALRPFNFSGFNDA